MNERIADPARRVLGGQLLDKRALRDLVAQAADNPFDLLYWASRIREAHFANKVHLCSIVAGKLGGCGEDCKWCAQSAASAPGAAGPQRLGLDQIVAAARDAAKLGAGCLGIVNSGRAPSRRDIDDVAAACDAIRHDDTARNLNLCASLGQLTEPQAARLASAGVRRYNHNLETSRRHFPNVVTTHTYDDRLRTAAVVRAAGLQLCCGCLFGLGETWDDRIDLALTLRDTVRPDVVPLNFLHPVAGTPLGGTAPLSPIEILTIIAIFRLAMPATRLKVAGGREVNLRDMQSWIFHAGATGCLIGNYLTTSGRPPREDLQMIADLGFEVAEPTDTRKTRWAAR
ncbi:MAG: biotin synthase BioB [Phycisphaerae bacterium]|nr:biotin synthase BioB [Phycisphaerae bacterium]